MPFSMDDLLATDFVRVSRKVSRYPITRPLTGPPYNDDTGYPERGSLVNISEYVANWSVSIGNRNAAAQAQLKVKPGLVVNVGDEIVVEEQYSSPSTGASAWIKQGTWYVEDLDYSLMPAEHVGTLTCFDAGYLLSIDEFAGVIEGDIIEVEKKALTLIEDPAVTGGDRRIYADGSAEDHTYNWTQVPQCELWADDKPIDEKTDAIDVVNGKGEVHIERKLFTDDEDDGGLGNPTNIYCHYWRYALEADSVDATLTSVTSSTLVASAATWTVDAFAGQHVIITSGDGAGKVFAVISNTETALSVDEDPTDWAIAATDTITIRDANLVETKLRDLLHAAGYQSADSALPFYIGGISFTDNIQVAPLRKGISSSVKHVSIVRDWLGQVAPNAELWTDVDGKIYFGEVTQGEADWTLSKATTVSLNNSSSGIYTKVIYRCRDKYPVNRAWMASGGSIIPILHFDHAFSTFGGWPDWTNVEIEKRNQAKNTTIFSTSNNPDDTALDADEALGQTVLSVAATTGFTVNDRARIWNAAGTVAQELGKVTEIDAGNTITVTNALTAGHSTGDVVQNVEYEYLAYEAAIDNDQYVLFRWQIDDSSLGADEDPLAGQDMFTVDLGDTYTLDHILFQPGKDPSDDWPARWGLLYSTDNANWHWLTNNIQFKAYFEPERIEAKDCEARYVKVRCVRSSAKDNHREAGIMELFIFTTDILAMEAECGVDRSGDTPAGMDFNVEPYITLREQLGRRTLVVPTQGVDENSVWAEDAEAYGQDRADEWLQAIARDYSRIRVRGVRPDCRLNDVVEVVVPALGLDSNYIVRALDMDSGGIFNAELVDYSA